jgi:guanylate kinase
LRKRSWKKVTENQGNLYIISSVAGGGKSTLIDLLLRKHPEILFSVSYTSRPIRGGEKNGLNYHFVSKEEFEDLVVKNYFYEWAQVHDNYYGTPKEFIEKNLKEGKKIILDIDVQGADKVKSSLPSCVSIFIVPPSREIWVERLKNRGTDDPQVIEKRIKNGLHELEAQDRFDNRIVNNELMKALDELESIILSN